MLKEKNLYDEGLPVKIQVAHINEYPIHFHEDIEVAYVLAGTVRLKNGYYQYVMQPGDIFILNDREIHSFYKTDDENLVLMLQFDMGYFSKYYPNLLNSFFVTDVEDTEDEGLETLRSILARIVAEFLEKRMDYEHRIIEDTHNLITCLMSEFQYFAMEGGKFVNETKKKENKILAGRMNRITEYMYENYSRKLTLGEIADREHLSIYYLSHVIREATGLSFQELLSFIRVEESEKLLLGTQKKIGRIAEETGFSAVRYYIKYFTKWFGMHPETYREQFTGQVSSRKTLADYEAAEPEEILTALRMQNQDVQSHFQRNDGSISLLNVDFSANKKYERSAPKQEIIFWKFMHRSNMAPVVRIFRPYFDLNEKILLSGPNYIVTTPVEANGGVDGCHDISVLICNNGSKQDGKDIFDPAWPPSRVLQQIKEYKEKIEVLVRISGMIGEYRIRRFKLAKENAIAAFECAASIGLKQNRSTLLKELEALPQISETRLPSAGSLSLQVELDGFGAELILVDCIE